MCRIEWWGCFGWVNFVKMLRNLDIAGIYLYMSSFPTCSEHLFWYPHTPAAEANKQLPFTYIVFFPSTHWCTVLSNQLTNSMEFNRYPNEIEFCWFNGIHTPIEKMEKGVVARSKISAIRPWQSGYSLVQKNITLSSMNMQCTLP